MATQIARGLRKQMTDAEKVLWKLLRRRQLGSFKFRRQRPIGPFVVDFACIERRLVVEADGGQHDGSQSDVRRSSWLEERGWRILRFWNNEILQAPDGVQLQILEVLKEIPPKFRRRNSTG
jgi:primosomal protein N' (replication factor Y)